MKLIQPFVVQAPEAQTEVTDEQKKQFAELLLKNPGEEFKCALVVFGSDTATAAEMACKWPRDPFVVEYQKQLVEQAGKLAFLPPQDEALRLAYDMACGKQIATAEMIKALDIYMKARGYYPKDVPLIQTNTQNVMIVRDHGNDQEWEEKALAQQRRLKAQVVESSNASDKRRVH